VSALGTAFTVTLVFGGVGVVAGIVLVFLPLDGSSDPAAGQPGQAAASHRARAGHRPEQHHVAR